MSYPASYDNVPAVTTGQLIQSSFVNSQSNAINATQQTLGLNPQGSSATVVARLNSLQAAVQQNGYAYAADTGTANNYAVALAPTPTLVAGMVITFLAGHSNTGASTLAVNGGSPIGIKKNGGTPLAASDIATNQMVTVIYDGTNFQFVASAPNNGGSGGSSNIYDLWANRPAAGISGRLFLPQDSAVFCVDDGSAWQNMGPRYPLHDPTGFTWSTSPTAPTGHSVGNGFANITNNSSNINVWLQHTVPSAPYTITAALLLAGSMGTTSSGISMGGIGVADNSSLTEYANFGGTSAGNIGFGVTRTNSDQTWHSNQASSAVIWAVTPMWLRIVDDTTHRTYYYSFNGINFWQLYQTTVTDYLTPTQVILACGNDASSAGVGVTCISWKESNSVITTGPDW